jgi:sec-independent protein translocase protein TatC
MFSFRNDLLEFKLRFMYTSLSFFVSFLTCYLYKDQLVFLFSKPLILLTGHSSKTFFIYTHMSEALVAQLKACFIVSLSVTVVCVLSLNLWLYVVPGLFQYERNSLNNFIALFMFFLIFGFWSSYQVFIPFVWKFLTGFGIQDNTALNPFSVVLEARIKDYIDFTFDLICLILLVFQIPFLIVILLLTNALTLKFCTLHRRYFLLISWIIAACVTPPDIISQSLVAIPLYGFTELVFLIFFCLNLRSNGPDH